MTMLDVEIGNIKLRRLLALCRKESAQIVRDPSSILIAFVLPVILLLIFGFGINLDANTVRIGLVVEDTGAEARRFAQVLEGSRYFDVVHDSSRQHARTLLAAGEIRGMVVIASDFSAKVRQGKGAAAIQVLTDGAEPNTANFLGNYMEGAWQTWLGQRSIDAGQSPPPLAELSARYWFNPSTVSRNFLLPGSISVIMTIIGALLTSLVIAREWERGTMESLLATPVSRMELLLSKILPYYVLGIFAMALCVVMATLIIGVPYRGSLLALFVVGSLFLGSSLGLGLFLSTTMRNQLMAAQAALTAAFLPATMLSGYVFEISSMPWPVQLASYFIPARYFVSALQTLFQAGDIWPILAINAAFLLASSIFWLGLTVLKFGRRLDD